MFVDTVKLTIGSVWIALSNAGIRYIQVVAVGPPIPPRWVQNSEASVLLLKSAPCDGGTSIGLNPAKVQLRRYRWKSRGQKSHPPNFDRSGAPDTQQPASHRKGSRQSEHTSDGLPCSLTYSSAWSRAPVHKPIRPHRMHTTHPNGTTRP